MSNIIDSIRLSGTTYQIQGGSITVDTALDSGSTNPVQNRVIYNKIDEVEEVTAAGLNALNDKINPTVELTQAQYDALTEKDPNTYYIITDAQAGDLTNYYTKSETNTLLGGKQATLVSGTNIKTINNESILGSGNIDIQSGSDINVVQTTGASTTDVMSQNAVTTQLNNKANKTAAVGGYRFGSSSDGDYIQYKNVNNSDIDNSIYYPKINGKGILTSNNIYAQNNYNFQLVETSAITTSVSSSSTDTQIPSAKAVYDAIQEGGGGGGTVDQTIISGSTNAVAGGAVYNKIDEVEQVTAAGLNVLNESKQDTLVSGTNIKTINNESILGSGNINIQGGGGTVESAITSGSTNAVESKAIWSATTFNKGILLTFNENNSTNYPEGCGKLVVNVVGYGSNTIAFKNNEGWYQSRIRIQTYDGINISVDTSEFGGATYEISGTTVILSYPSTGITSVQTYEHRWTYTAVVEGALVNDNTYMKSEVDAIASGLQNNINSKLDATAYTPTVVDSALNVASTNPIQNQALYSELRIDNGETETTLTFENEASTNYPNGCTKLIVEVVGSNNSSSILFYNGNNTLGNINIMNHGRINVSAAFDGATYEISGTTVIINYPTVTSVTNISVSTFDSGNYVYKAIVALATPLKNQVVANTTALGGMKLVKLSEAEYNALATKDSSTLYVIVN